MRGLRPFLEDLAGMVDGGVEILPTRYRYFVQTLAGGWVDRVPCRWRWYKITVYDVTIVGLRLSVCDKVSLLAICIIP
jgi:hypothetical protein